MNSGNKGSQNQLITPPCLSSSTMSPRFRLLAGHEHAHEREAHGDFVRDDLRRGAHGAQQRVFRIGRPSGQDHAVDTERCQCQHIQQPGVDVGNDKPREQRNDGPGSQRRHQRQQRCNNKQEAVGLWE